MNLSLALLTFALCLSGFALAQLVDCGIPFLSVRFMAIWIGVFMVVVQLLVSSFSARA